MPHYSYMQARHLPKSGFVFFFTMYQGGRQAWFARSADGLEWTQWTPLAEIEEGHYQISAANSAKVASAFNYHPRAFQGYAKKNARRRDRSISCRPR